MLILKQILSHSTIQSIGHGGTRFDWAAVVARFAGRSNAFLHLALRSSAAAGVNTMQPRENQGLAEQILAPGGSLISEFVIPTPPTPQNFSNSESHSYFRIASSAAFPWTCQLSRRRSTAELSSSRQRSGLRPGRCLGTTTCRHPEALPPDPL